MRLACLALLVLLAAAPAAQVALPAPPERAASGRDGFALATRLLANGQAEEAVPLLEDLLAADPESVPVWLKLREAYAVARQFDRLAEAVDARIARQGPSVGLLAERGVALYRAGRTDDAERAWAEAVAVAPAEEMTYRVVSNAVGSLRLFAEAADVLDAGRQALGDDDLFLLERAHLYGLGLDYQAAAEAYLQALADRPEALGSVQAQLARLMTGQDAPETFAAAVDRAITRDPLNRAFRELSWWLALERKDYDAALDAVRALDRLEREQGETLLSFAAQAAGAGADEAAARALDEVLARHADGPAAAPALLARADLSRQRAEADRERAERGPTPHADAALNDYRDFLDAHPNAPRAPAAALALAGLLRDVYRDFDAAETRLVQASVGREQGVAAEARLALGEVAIRRGSLDAARERFADVEEALRIGPLAEQARYELALLDFYEGFMFSALARAEALDENTAADASNDAIALRVTLTETLDQDAPPAPDEDLTDDPLHVYARAALLHRRALPSEALAVLDTLDAGLPPDHALGDESLFLRAAVLRQSDQAAAAVAALDRLAEGFPLSFFRDRALRLQALALERDLDDPAGAAERWDRLLELFPGSLYAPEARLELRRLRTPS